MSSSRWRPADRFGRTQAVVVCVDLGSTFTKAAAIGSHGRMVLATGGAALGVMGAAGSSAWGARVDLPYIGRESGAISLANRGMIVA